MTSAVRGRVFDVQRFCVHDGPGIRTTVFLSGCSLRCAWCHNPESFDAAAGSWRAPEWVLEEVLKDADYFETSAGGVTLSGGEPLLQPAFVRAVLELAKANGLHTCVQTAAHVSRASLVAVMDLVDLFQVDLKHLDAATHRALTGHGNERILENAAWLLEQGRAVELRMPLVPGLNDAPANLERLATFLSSRGVGALHVLPYQRTYLPKYERLGLTARCAEVSPPGPAQLGAVRAVLGARGIDLLVDA